MAKILQFPSAAICKSAQAPPKCQDQLKRRPHTAFPVKLLWVVTVLIWPLIKWLASLEVAYQFCRMLYHWDTPHVHAGWQFLAHFAALTAVTYFVSLYKPTE